MECSSEHFPAGLRVLVVDDDPICLLIVERLLRSCSYQVTTCGAALIALSMLREDRSRFDVVLSDVHMPEMDGFKLLELVRLEMDVPVIMMSTNKETSSVMKGIAHGACDYLLKPVRLEELRNIWQHVVRKQQCAVSKGSDRASVPRDHVHRHRKVEMDTKTTSDDRSSSCVVTQKKRKASLDEEIANDDDDSFATAKRQRVVWSVELHQKFVSAINHLGLEQAVPKRILDLMNVPNLTRENVASHLQKYRLYLKKMSGSLSQKLSIAGSSVGASGSFINSFAFLNGYSTAQALELFSQQSSALPFLPGMPGIHREEAMNSSDHLGAKQAGIDPSLEHKDLQLVDANLQGHLVTSPGIKDGRLQLLIGQHMGTGGPISYPKAGFGYPCDQLSPGLYSNSDLLSQQGVKGSPLTEGPNANKYGAYTADHLPIQALDTSAGLGSVPYTTLHSVFDLIEK